jgi:DNA ligase-1
MLATNVDLTKLEYPVYASRKLDGIRAIVYNDTVYSRNGKPIPNKHVQALFGKLNGSDGELIVGDPTAKDVFQKTTSGVMSVEGEPDVFLYEFDVYNSNSGYETRWDDELCFIYMVEPENVIAVEQELITNEQELLAFEQKVLAEGYEGVILRKPCAKYKHGRSTVKEGALLKLKRFSDAEAEIVGAECLYTNTNEATVNALGYTERSTKKEGKVALDTLGAFIVKNKEGVEFSIGSGFNDEQRKEYWKDRYKLIGKTVKYKYFEVGVKDKPRFPIFLGFRAEGDMDE